MSDPGIARRLGRLAAGVFELPFRVLSVSAEWALCRRGLAVAFLLGAAALAVAGWVRPPLSRDITSLRLPLGIDTSTAAAEDLLHEQPRLRLDSVGTLILTAVGLGLLLVLARPKRLGVAAGFLLCAALASCAAAALNHPGLVELMDSQAEQRHLMSRVINVSPEEHALADVNNSRVEFPALFADGGDLPDLVRGWVYLSYGPWLILWAVIGILLGGSGSLPRRLGHLAAWCLLATALAGGLCSQRLWAEYHWLTAAQLEAERDYDNARAALQTAIEIFPEFENLERTWLLAGKLDWRDRRSTPQSVLYLAYQLRRHKDRPQALALVDDLRALGADRHSAVRQEAASLFTEAGLDFYRREQLAAAEDAWRKACQAVPARVDSTAGVVLVRGRTDCGSAAHLAQAEVAPMLARLADRPLRADILTALGHTYFGAGDFAQARKCFAHSLTAFSLPKRINYGAQKGLGGL